MSEPIIAKDYLGNELQVGDDVVFVRLNYRCFMKGKIKKLTKCFVMIEQTINGYTKTVKQAHNQVLRVVL